LPVRPITDRNRKGDFAEVMSIKHESNWQTRGFYPKITTGSGRGISSRASMFGMNVPRRPMEASGTSGMKGR